jgi:hypothetical protein
MKRTNKLDMSNVVKVVGTMYGMRNYNRKSTVISEERWEKVKEKHNKKLLKLSKWYPNHLSYQQVIHSYHY